MTQNEMKPVRITDAIARGLLCNVSRVIKISSFETGKRMNLKKATAECQLSSHCSTEYYVNSSCEMRVSYRSDSKIEFWNEISGSYEIWFDGTFKLYFIEIYSIKFIIAEAFGFVNVYRLV